MEDIDQYLSSIYFNPKHPGSYGGVDRLFNEVRKEGEYDLSRKQITEWLMKQEAYTLHKTIRRNFKRN